MATLAPNSLMPSTLAGDWPLSTCSLQLTRLLLHWVTCAASAQGVLQPWVRVWAGRSGGKW